MIDVTLEKVEDAIEVYIYRRPQRTVKATSGRRGEGRLVQELVQRFNHAYTPETIELALKNLRDERKCIQLEKTGSAYSTAVHNGVRPRGCQPRAGSVNIPDKDINIIKTLRNHEGDDIDVNDALRTYEDKLRHTENLTKPIEKETKTDMGNSSPGAMPPKVTPPVIFKAPATVENLNRALAALRLYTDSKNRLTESSAADVIQKRLSCSEHQARTLNGKLGEMGFRFSENRGGGKFRTTVVSGDTPGMEKVTAAHLAELKKHSSKPKKASSKTAKKSAEVESKDTSAKATPANAPAQVDTQLTLEKLGQIILGLEKKLAQLSEENELLKRSNEDLTAQLAQRHTIAPPEVLDILGRYAT